jgi:hypothetical protein
VKRRILKCRKNLKSYSKYKHVYINHKKIYFYKMVNGLVPPYLSAIVPCNF